MTMLSDKVALITGAGGGIGQAVARKFVSEGARVCLVDSNESSLAKISHDLGDCAVAVAADVSKDDEASRYVRAALDAFGRIDIAFLNAGILGKIAQIEDTPIDVFDRVMQVNVRGVWLGLAAILPIFKRQRGGSIVITSSITGVRGTQAQAAYVTSKHAVIGLMKTAALEAAAANVRVNAICPAPVETEMMSEIERGLPFANRQLAKDRILAGIPLGRYALVNEIAEMVTFLSSDKASYCTGGAYMIDGGGMAGVTRSAGFDREEHDNGN